MRSLHGIFMQRTWRSRFVRASVLACGVVMVGSILFVMVAPGREGAYADLHFLGSQVLVGVFLILTASADFLHDRRERSAMTLRVLALGAGVVGTVLLVMSELVSLGVFVLVGAVFLVFVYTAHRANREV